MIKVWNKIDSINGVSASEVKKSMNIKSSDEIFLVVDDITNKVSEIQFKDIICSNYGIDISLSCMEVANKYIEKLEEEKTKIAEEKITMEQLKEENEMLKQCVLELSEVVYA